MSALQAELSATAQAFFAGRHVALRLSRTLRAPQAMGPMAARAPTVRAGCGGVPRVDRAQPLPTRWASPLAAKEGAQRAASCSSGGGSITAEGHFSNVDKLIAKLHYGLKEYSKAIEDILEALKKSPRDQELYTLLSDAYSQLGQRKKGSQARLIALQLDRSSHRMDCTTALAEAEAYLQRGGDHYCREALETVLSCLEHARPQPPAATLAELYRVASEAYARMGCPRDAVAAALLAAEARPEDASTRLLLVLRHMELAQEGVPGRSCEVLSLASQGIDLAAATGETKFLPLFHRARGKVLLSRGQVEEALRDFEEYHRLAPGTPEPYLLLSDAYEEMGKLQASVENLEKAVRLDHENEEAKEALAQRLMQLLRGAS